MTRGLVGSRDDAERAGISASKIAKSLSAIKAALSKEYGAAFVADMGI